MPLSIERYPKEIFSGYQEYEFPRKENPGWEEQVIVGKKISPEIIHLQFTFLL